MSGEPVSIASCFGGDANPESSAGHAGSYRRASLEAQSGLDGATEFSGCGSTGSFAIYHLAVSWVAGVISCSRWFSVVGSSERSEPIGTEAPGEDNFAGSGPSVFGWHLITGSGVGIGPTAFSVGCCSSGGEGLGPLLSTG